MGSDDVAAILAGIRQRYSCTRAPITGNSVTTLFASAADIPSLVAAVEAVLELADKFDTIPAYGPTPDTRHRVARLFREAITAALTGAQPGEDGEHA